MRDAGDHLGELVEARAALTGRRRGGSGIVVPTLLAAALAAQAGSPVTATAVDLPPGGIVVGAATPGQGGGALRVDQALELGQAGRPARTAE